MQHMYGTSPFECLLAPPVPLLAALLLRHPLTPSERSMPIQAHCEIQEINDDNEDRNYKEDDNENEMMIMMVVMMMIIMMMME